MPPLVEPLKTTQTHSVAVQDVQLPRKYGGMRCRLYYPTSRPYSYWRRHRRLPRDGPDFWPPNVTARGVAKFAGLPGFLGIFVQMVAGHTDGVRHGEVLEGKKFGVAIFSHGLAGVGSGYCRLCEDIAKMGKMVVAIEHSEGSALGTVVENDEGKKVVYFEKRGKGLKGDRDWRREQVKKRVEEVKGVVRWLRDVNKGIVKNYRMNGDIGVDLKNRLDAKKVSIVGHSFGGATAIGFALDYPNQCKKVCVMDPWLWPLGRDWLKKSMRPDLKILVIKNELSKMGTSQKIIESIKGENLSKEKIIIKGATHHIQTDFAFLLPKFIAKRFGLMKKSGRNPAELNHLNNEICAAFCCGEWEKFKENFVADGRYLEGIEYSDA